MALAQMAVVIPAGYLNQSCLLEFNNNCKLKRLTVVQYSDSSYFPDLNCLFSPFQMGQLHAFCLQERLWPVGWACSVWSTEELGKPADSYTTESS